MINAHLSSNEDAFLSNMTVLNARAHEAYEARVCELALYAERLASECAAMLDSGISLTEALSVIGEGIIHAKGPLSDGIITEAFSDMLTECDKAELSRLLTLRMEERGIDFSIDVLFSEASDKSSVRYVKNALSDEAYEVFSEEHELSVSYAGTFDEACRAVSDGEVGYCILPLEESGGVRSRRIIKMLLDLSLKILSITPVFGFDGRAEVKYALIGQGLRVPEISEGDEEYIDLYLRASDTEGALRLCSSLGVLGLSLVRVSQYSDTDKQYFSLILKDAGAGFAPLITYLTVFCQDFTILGIYKNLE